MENPDRRATPAEWVSAVLRAWIRVSVIIAVVVGLIYCGMRLKVMLAYLIIGIILAYAMRPIAGWMIKRPGFRSFHEIVFGTMDKMIGFFHALITPMIVRPERRRPRRTFQMSRHGLRAVATFYVLILFILGGFYSVKFMFYPFSAEIKKVSQHWGKKNDQDLQMKIEMARRNAMDWYETNVSEELREKIEKQIQEKQDSGGGDMASQIGQKIGGLMSHASGLAHNIVEIVLLPVLAFYFALDSRKLKREFVGSLTPRLRKETLRVIREFNLIMHSFVVGQVILCALAGLIVWLVLWGLGVPYALTLGLLAGFTRAIPIVGPILGGIPIIGIALVTAGPATAIWVLAAFTIMHFAESKFIMPMLIGERMELHPVLIIIVLLIGQEFGGLLGMFFAAPIAGLIRWLVRRYWLKTHHRHSIHGLTTDPELT